MESEKLIELVNAVAAATEWARGCAITEREARSESTAAANKLNEAQKALDEYIAKMKAAAPRDSDWGRSYIEARRAAPVGGTCCEAAYPQKVD